MAVGPEVFCFNMFINFVFAQILLLLLQRTFSFYIPGTATDYHDGDFVPVDVNVLTSIHTHLPFEYYSLPFPRPSGYPQSVMRDETENLGEVLMGDRIRKSPYREVSDIKTIIRHQLLFVSRFKLGFPSNVSFQEIPGMVGKTVSSVLSKMFKTSYFLLCGKKTHLKPIHIFQRRFLSTSPCAHDTLHIGSSDILSPRCKGVTLLFAPKKTRRNAGRIHTICVMWGTKIYCSIWAWAIQTRAVQHHNHNTNASKIQKLPKCNWSLCFCAPALTLGLGFGMINLLGDL